LKKIITLFLLLVGGLSMAVAQQFADPDAGSPPRLAAGSGFQPGAAPQPYYQMGPSLPYERYSYEQMVGSYGYLRGSYQELTDSPARRAQALRLKSAGVLKTVTAYYPFGSYMWRGGSKNYVPGKSRMTATPAGESVFAYSTPVSQKRYKVWWKGKPALQQWSWYKYYAHEKCVNELLKGAPPAYVVEVITIPGQFEPALNTPEEETVVKERVVYVDRIAPAPLNPQIVFSPVLGSGQRALSGFTRTNVSLTQFTYYVFEGGVCIQQGCDTGGPPDIGPPPPVFQPPPTTPPNPVENPRPDPIVPNPGPGNGPPGPGNGGTPISVPPTRNRGGGLVLQEVFPRSLPVQLQQQLGFFYLFLYL
jgi:hypothetical protein